MPVVIPLLVLISLVVYGFIRGVKNKLDYSIELLEFQDINLRAILTEGLSAIQSLKATIQLTIINPTRFSIILEDVNINIFYQRNLLARTLPSTKKLFIAPYFNSYYNAEIKFYVNEKNFAIIDNIITGNKTRLDYVITAKWLIFPITYTDYFDIEMDISDIAAMLS